MEFGNVEIRDRLPLDNVVKRAWKRGFDLVGAAVLIVLLSPFMLLTFFLIRKTGPQAIFSHERVGFAGKPFKCLKFRTMVVNAQDILEELLESDPLARAEWEKDFKLKSDPRITRVGGFLRKTSLDELPQLFNVIKGEMSLVGPRPVIEEEIERYGAAAAFYYSVRPGMTGLWQVSGRNDTSYEERINMDVNYVVRWGWTTDIVVLFKTVGVVIFKKGSY